MYREEWLNTLLKKLYSHFKDNGVIVPENIRVSVGFPSKGIKSKAIGECWDMMQSEDNFYEIFIHPNQADPVRVAGILVHEIIHTIVKEERSHGPEFKQMALKMGLCGKMKATEETPELVGKLENIIKEIGPYPHSKLKVQPPEKAPAKNGPVKAVCTREECGYHVRISQKWIDKGFPTCPCGEEMQEEEKVEA